MKLEPLGYKWPFPCVNGQRTPESLALEALPKEPKKSPYQIAISDPDVEEALL